MLFASVIFHILAIALPSLRISPLFFTRIATIVLLYAAALYTVYLSVVYIQSIGSGIVVYSGLFISSLLPIKPGDVKPSHRLTNLEKQQFSLPDELKQILVGLLLGDLHAQKQSVNTRLVFIQGTLHQEYLEHLYDLFKNYCSQAPKIYNPKPDKRTGKVYSVMDFKTFSLPCFNELYELFYSSGVKSIPDPYIYDLLTPLGLAY
jgi:hypothetical protein